MFPVIHDKITLALRRNDLTAQQGEKRVRLDAERGFARGAVASRRPQIGWWIFLAAITLIVLEGAIRKWVVGSAFQLGSYVAYFSKDLVFALLLFCPIRAKPSAAWEVFRRWLIPGCFLLACGAVSSMTQEINVAGAVLTLRAALFLPAMALLVAPRLQGISLRSVSCFIGLLAILNFPLGVIQNNLLPDHLLNRYATETSDITTAVMGVRATGTFSYITGMAIISVVGIWAGIVTMSLGATVRQQLFGWVVLAAGVGCGLSSVSRGPILIGCFMVSVWLLFSGDWAAKKSHNLIAGMLLLGLVISFNLTKTFSQLGQGLLQRTETSEDTAHERSLGQFEEALMALDMAPFGNGLGTEQVGRYHYSQREMSNTTFESQLARLVLETGVLGLVGFVVICVGALLTLQVAKKHSTMAGAKAAILATQLLLLSMFLTNVVFNHVASAFVWMIFTAVLAASMPRRRALSSAIRAVREHDSNAVAHAQGVRA
jgi:hypothetical protein